MWKIIRFAIKFIVVWEFTIWFYNLLGLPILNLLQWILNISSSFGAWLVSGSDGSIIFLIPTGLVSTIGIITWICVKNCKPTYYPPGYY